MRTRTEIPVRSTVNTGCSRSASNRPHQSPIASATLRMVPVGPIPSVANTNSRWSIAGSARSGRSPPNRSRPSHSASGAGSVLIRPVASSRSSPGGAGPATSTGPRVAGVGQAQVLVTMWVLGGDICPTKDRVMVSVHPPATGTTTVSSPCVSIRHPRCCSAEWNDARRRSHHARPVASTSRVSAPTTRVVDTSIETVSIPDRRGHRRQYGQTAGNTAPAGAVVDHSSGRSLSRPRPVVGVNL